MDTELSVTVECLVPGQILTQPIGWQTRLKKDLKSILWLAFPEMSEEDVIDHVNDYFRMPGQHFQRQAILLRNRSHQAIAAMVFDLGTITYESFCCKGAYIINRAVIPAYHDCKLGQRLLDHFFIKWNPDLVLTTCAHSSALHSWVGMVQKHRLPDFEVYPRLELHDGHTTLTTLPYHEFQFITSVFAQFYLGIVEQRQERVEYALRHLRDCTVRKGLYAKNRYDYNPWERHGRKDALAQALGVTELDGVLVVLKRKGLLTEQ